MEPTSPTTVKLLLYFPKRSRFSPGKEGEFILTAEYGENYVFRGKALSVEEFNAIPAYVFEENRYSQQPRVKAIAVEAPQVKAQEPVTTQSTAETIQAKPEQEAPRRRTKKRGRKSATTEAEIRALLASVK